MAKVLTAPDFYAHAFEALHKSNYTVGRGGVDIDRVVVHLMAGTFWGSISWGRNSASNVSWTYAIARDGYTAQCVSEANACWTNGHWNFNQRSVTLEHAGTLADGGPTEAMLHASAKLVAGICYRHGIPVDRQHIIGHNEVPGSQKPCPGPWPWQRYINLIRAYRFPPKPPVQSAPSGTVWRVLVGSFSHKENADSRAGALKRAGFGESWVYKYSNVWRVQNASFSDQKAADELVMKLKAAKFEAYALAEKK